MDDQRGHHYQDGHGYSGIATHAQISTTPGGALHGSKRLFNVFPSVSKLWEDATPIGPLPDQSKENIFKYDDKFYQID